MFVSEAVSRIYFEVGGWCCGDAVSVNVGGVGGGWVLGGWVVGGVVGMICVDVIWLHFRYNMACHGTISELNGFDPGGSNAWWMNETYTY